MLPIPMLISLVKTFVGKNLIKIVLIVAAIAAGFYAIHLIKESGRDEIRAEWKAAADDSQREADEYLKLKDIEHKRLTEAQTKYYVGAINENERLREESRAAAVDSANSRMYVNTRIQNNCGSTGQTEAKTVSRNDQTPGNIQPAELDRSTEQNIRRDYAEVDLAAKDVLVLLDMIKNSQCFEVVK